MIHSSSSKEARSEFRKKLLDETLLAVQQFVLDHDDYAELPIVQLTSRVVSDVEYELMRKMILTEGRRLDGRGLTDIRPITCEVGPAASHARIRTLYAWRNAESDNRYTRYQAR